MLISRKTGSATRLASRTSKKTASSPVRVWRPWILVEIGFLLAVIALFNLFPQLIGIDRSPDAASEPMPFIAPGFIETMPWLNLWWGLALGLNLVILFLNFRQPLVRWARLGINIFGLFLLLRLVFAGPIIGLNPAWLSVQSADAATLGRVANELAPILSLTVTVAISVAIVALGYSSLAKLRYLSLSPIKNIRSDLDGVDPL
ncbi:MAG: hypothetical protein WA996_19140 [Candidatus Promineifilaceae bacterium]